MKSKAESLRYRRINDEEYANRVRGYSKAYRERNLEKERERQRKSKAKRRTECKETNNAYMREWNAKNRERLNAQRRERLRNDPEYAEKVRAADRARHLANPSKRRKELLKSYGLTIDDYNSMYEKQEGKCAICGTVKKRCGHDGLVVDHCHNKGHVRGLLCSSCNNGLGRFKDSIESLKKAADYLMKYSEGENHVSTQ